jgi:hypothetical protein
MSGPSKEWEHQGSDRKRKENINLVQFLEYADISWLLKCHLILEENWQEITCY